MSIKMTGAEWNRFYTESGRHADQWVSPLALDGQSGSHHRQTLHLLVRHGLALCKKNSGKIYDSTNITVQPRLSKRAKGSCAYQVTKAGLEHLQSAGLVKGPCKPDP